MVDNRNLNKSQLCPCCYKDDYIVPLSLNKKCKKFLSLSNERYKGYLEKITREDDIKIKKCKSCGHFWYDWLPEENLIIKMYDHHIRQNKKVNQKIIKNKEEYIFKELSLLKNNFNKAIISFLDYGSGMGLWTKIAQNLDLDTYSFEPSIKRALESKIKVIYDLNNFKDTKFDIINLEQVLEHIVHPELVLKDLRRVSKSNTIFRIRVPNINRSKEGKNFYKDWPYNGKNMHTLSPYEHIHGFTQKSLLKLCKNSGFNIDWKFIFFNKPLLIIRILLGNFIKPISVTEIYLKNNNITETYRVICLQ